VSRILESLRPLVDEAVLLTNDADLAQVGDVRLLLEPAPHAGVLPALATGLEAATGDVCLAVACDMPFVSGSLFRYLLALRTSAGADVVIPRTSDLLEPMHAVYRRLTVLPAIRAALARGEQRMISYFRDVRVREVGEDEWHAHDPSGLAFFNVNTPDDLAEARRLAKAQDS